MSSYLSVDLKNKKTGEKISLFWLPTTPARELYGTVPYTADKDEFYQPFTNELYEDILKYYDEEIKSWNNFIKRNNDELDLLEKRILKVTKSEIYEKIQSDINDLMASNRESKEEIDKINYYKELFGFAMQVLENNTSYSGKKEDVYELVYSLD